MLSPFLALGIAAVPLLIRRGLAGIATVATLAAYTLTVGLWYTFTSGGGGPPGRYMVATVPLLGVMFAVGLDRLLSIARVRLLAIIVLIPACAWSIALSFLVFADRPLALGASGPARYLASALGLPLDLVAIPNFADPTAGSFAKVGLAVAVIIFLAFPPPRRQPSALPRLRWPTRSFRDRVVTRLRPPGLQIGLAEGQPLDTALTAIDRGVQTVAERRCGQRS